MVSESGFEQNILLFICLSSSDYNNVKSKTSLPQNKAGLMELIKIAAFFFHNINFYIHFCSQNTIFFLTELDSNAPL